jgi:hypothetical protein
MFDLWSMEILVRDALQPPDQRELELLQFMSELKEAGRQRSWRRRLAEALVAVGRRLDPEAVSLAPRQVTLEAAHVRD